MTDFEAEEYFDFNIAGAYVGDTAPCFITFGKLFEEKVVDNVSDA